MKRIVTLLLLLAGIAAAAQNSPKYEHFKELRNETDTVGMKRMLDDWGRQDPEYYSAWTNYCQVMAEETGGETWQQQAVGWVKMGREEFPDDELLLLKQAEVLFNYDQFRDALPVLNEIEEKGLGEGVTWYYLQSIYALKGDFVQARHYLNKMVEEGDENDRAYAQEILASYDKVEQWADSLAIYPDHAAIKDFSQTPAFQELISRFEACDTTLTRKEIATVYYGSSYLKDYNLVSRSGEDIRKMVEEGKTGDAVEALQNKLKEYPVSLYLIISLYNLIEDEEALMPIVWKANALLSVIDNTGRLNMQERPFQVICVNDEYIFLQQVMDMSQFLEQSLLESQNGPLDKMTFLPASYDLDVTAYFQITPPYWERLAVN